MIDIMNYKLDGTKTISIDSNDKSLLWSGKWEQSELEELHNDIKLLSKEITLMKSMSVKKYTEFWEED